MAKQEDLLFAKVALKSRLVDADKLEKCLALVDRAGVGSALVDRAGVGSALVDRAGVDSALVDRAGVDRAGVDRAGDGPSLGRFLVEKGLISAGQYNAIRARVEQQLAQSSSGEASPAAKREAAASEARTDASGRRIWRIAEIEKRDFSSYAGKPLDEYMKLAREIGASDLHFQVDSPPFVRLHGQIVYLKHPALTPEVTAPAVDAVLDEKGREVFRKRRDYDFSYVTDHGRYRATVFQQRKGVDAVFRVIPDKVPTLEELHLPKALEKFTKYRQGIVLVTGPSGCGKTATMTALLDMINRQQHDHIVMVEDPIEYIVPSQSCNVNQRQVQRHTENYATALRSAMRSDPDYICVGEMRDLETVSMAITAAETGHLVLATLHTTNAVRSVDRIIDIFPPKEQEQIRAMVSESLRGIISQLLVPRADGFGREPALEILFVNAAVGNMIRERKTFQLASVLQTGAKQGMVTMDESLLELLKKKIITRETARYYAFQKDRF